MNKIELFISHTSRDNEVIEQFSALIANCFDIRDDKIRCSSATRFQYQFGAKLLEEIREDIKDSLVIVFISKNIKESDWVLLELGIAMTLAKRTIVTIIDKSEIETIPKYLQNSLVVNLSDTKNLTSLISNISKINNWGSDLKDINIVNDEIKNFLLKINPNAYRYPTQKLLQRKNVLNEKNNLRWSQISSVITEHLIITGWSCRSIFGAHSDNSFRNILKSGKRITIVIQSSDAIDKSPLLNFGPVCNHKEDPKRILLDIDMGKAVFQEFYDKLDTESKRNIQLIETNWLITWSSVSVDMETDNGVLQIEFYHYNDPVNEHLEARPNLILTKESEFYLGFKNSIKSIVESMDTN